MSESNVPFESILKRAQQRYVRDARALGGVPCEPSGFNSLDNIERHGDEWRVVFRNSYRLLAIYRVLLKAHGRFTLQSMELPRDRD